LLSERPRRRFSPPARGRAGLVGARGVLSDLSRSRCRRLPREEQEGEISDWLSAYHAVLAVNRPPTGFRGINGCLPAKTRVPSIYSTVPSSRN
jgi:hypothetical protein